MSPLPQEAQHKIGLSLGMQVHEKCLKIMVIHMYIEQGQGKVL